MAESEKVNLRTARAKLSELVTRAEAGESFVITRDGKDAAECGQLPRPTRLPRPRRPRADQRPSSKPSGIASWRESTVATPTAATRVASREPERQRNTGAQCILCMLYAGNSAGIRVYRYPLRRPSYAPGWKVGDRIERVNVGTIALCDDCVDRHVSPTRKYRHKAGRKYRSEA